MKQWTKSLRLGLGSAAILTCLLLAAPVAAQNQDDQGQNDQGQNYSGRRWVPSPEPATLTLIALGGGAAALVRYRKSRRIK